MKCRETRKLLEAYIDGTLSRDIEEDVAAHLSSCAKCTREYTEIKNYTTALSSMDFKKAPPGLLEGIHAGIREQEARGFTARVRIFMERFNIPSQLKIPVEAAGLLAVVFLAFMLYSPFDAVKESIPYNGAPIIDEIEAPEKIAGRLRDDRTAKSVKIERSRIPDEEINLASKAVLPDKKKMRAPASSEITVTEKIAKTVKKDSIDSVYRIVLGPGREYPAAAKGREDENPVSDDLSRITGSSKRRAGAAADKSIAEVEVKKEMPLQKAPDRAAGRSIAGITKDFGGTVLSSVDDPLTGMPRSLTVRIPAGNLEQYMKRLRADRPVIEEQLPAPGGREGSVTIRIILHSQQN